LSTGCDCPNLLGLHAPASHPARNELKAQALVSSRPFPEEAGPGGFAPGRLGAFRHDVFWRDALRRRVLALADAAAVAIAIAVATVTSDQVDTGFWAAIFLPIWIVMAKIHGLYDRDHRVLRHLTVDEVPSILLWALTGTGATALLSLLTPSGSVGISFVFQMGLIAALGAFLLRGMARFLWRRVMPPDQTIILGSGPLAEATRRKLELFPDIHVRLVDGDAEFDCRTRPLPAVDRIIVVSQGFGEDAIGPLVVDCRRAHLKLTIVPPVHDLFSTAVRLSHVAELPVVECNTSDVSRSTIFLKRIMDIAGSVAALVILAPLFLGIALAIRLDSRGTIFFVQQRAGRGGRPFRMVKFRTMVADAEDLLADLVPFETLDDPMFKLRDDPRVTRVGRFLRRTSLDELPQLINVLRGEMSLVGPRPEQVELVERYRPEHRFRLSVKPGLTGPMQVYGRGELTFEERLAVEREYVENLSLGRDLQILGMTLSVVVHRKGAF
jgi:exopolysaccharide biosynthesis polyprenyl glycosylphosphotransferase